MKKIQLPNHLLTEIQNISRAHNVDQLYLFGSRARGDADERSDIDLAAYAPHANQKDWLTFYFAIKNIETLLNVDVVRVEEASNELKEKIQQEGKLVYEK